MHVGYISQQQFLCAGRNDRASPKLYFNNSLQIADRPSALTGADIFMVTFCYMKSFLYLSQQAASFSHIFSLVFRNKVNFWEFSHSYRPSWHYQSFIYSPTDAPVSCLKETVLNFTLKQLRHVSVLQLHRNMSELF